MNKTIHLILITGIISLISSQQMFANQGYFNSQTVFLQDTTMVDSGYVEVNIPFLVETNSSLRFFRYMDNSSSVMFYVPSGETVEVFEEIDDYFSAKYNGEKGYIIKSKVKPLNFEMARADSMDLSQSNKKDRLAYLLENYDEETAHALYEHKLWKGMTTKMAIDSWGSPLTMDRYHRVGESIEDWHYSKYTLVFTDGKLARWTKN
ncbi:MAG: SH3 domain-containing protein [Bacteroidales bacterium]|nr:SH3 domain-containing protein [Bacteroidales bacterium]